MPLMYHAKTNRHVLVSNGNALEGGDHSFYSPVPDRNNSFSRMRGNIQRGRAVNGMCTHSRKAIPDPPLPELES